MCVCACCVLTDRIKSTKLQAMSNCGYFSLFPHFTWPKLQIIQNYIDAINKRKLEFYDKYVLAVDAPIEKDPKRERKKRKHKTKTENAKQSNEDEGFAETNGEQTNNKMYSIYVVEEHKCRWKNGKNTQTNYKIICIFFVDFFEFFFVLFCFLFMLLLGFCDIRGKEMHPNRDFSLIALRGGGVLRFA